MPDLLLVVLVLAVAGYLVQVSGATIGFLGASRVPSPASPDDEPVVSVVVTEAAASSDVEATVDALRACVYPEGEWEILLATETAIESSALSSDEGGGGPRRIKHVSSASRGVSLTDVAEAARGEILLITTAGATMSPEWISAMARRCSPEAPLVVGPIQDEHDDLFLPRLQALRRYGEIAYEAGLLHLGIPSSCAPGNVAIRSVVWEARRRHTAPTIPFLVQHVAYDADGSAVFNPDVDASVSRAPVPSFRAYFRRLTRSLDRTLQTPYTGALGLEVGRWLTHTLLLGCCLGAVVLPGWRQPSLLALAAKMGGDLLLMIPGAQHFGHRQLLRSFVPTQLLLLGTIPVAGLVAAWNRSAS